MAIRIIRTSRTSHPRQATRLYWNTIFGGAFLMLGLGLFFISLGNAVGLNMTNITNPGVHGALRFWSWFYNAVLLVVSYVVGAAISNRNRDVESVSSGGAHGMISWGLASTIGAFLLLGSSATGRGVLAGSGPDSGNWFLLCVLGCGCIGSILAGMSGKHSAQSAQGEVTSEQTTHIEEKKGAA